MKDKARETERKREEESFLKASLGIHSANSAPLRRPLREKLCCNLSQMK